MFETDVESRRRLPDADLVIASDGLNSRVRSQYADHLPARHRPAAATASSGSARTSCSRPSRSSSRRPSTAGSRRTPTGSTTTTSTFIVESPEQVWRGAGLDRDGQGRAIAFCERLFADDLDGHPLISNAAPPARLGAGSTSRAWSASAGRTATAARHVVLMGDAAHTAHFSIGSGTKLAMEDAIELRALASARTPRDLPAALPRYEALRSVEVLRIQNAARNTMEWFEHVARYVDLPPEQFAYTLLTRSQRISHENLRLRDPATLEGYERLVRRARGRQRADAAPAIAADVHAVHAARRDAREPHRRLADGAVLARRRHARRLPPRPPRRARAWAAPGSSSPR